MARERLDSVINHSLLVMTTEREMETAQIRQARKRAKRGKLRGEKFALINKSLHDLFSEALLLSLSLAPRERCIISQYLMLSFIAI